VFFVIGDYAALEDAIRFTNYKRELNVIDDTAQSSKTGYYRFARYEIPQAR